MPQLSPTLGILFFLSIFLMVLLLMMNLKTSQAQLHNLESSRPVLKNSYF